MSELIKCIFILICIYYCHTQQYELNKTEGLPCFVNGRNGTCINKFRCYEMMDFHKNPKMCSFEGSVPIVCCTECHEFHRKDIGNGVLDSELGIVFWKNGRKAWDKCIDYLRHNWYPCNNRYYSTITLRWDEDRQCGDPWQYVHTYPETGHEAPGAELPHMALLGYGDDMDTAQWLCGGSIISERFILTAAHCISTSSLGSVKYAALGVLKRSDPPETWQRHYITQAIPHPDYKSPSKYHDIALLRTTLTIRFSRFILPACLPSKSSEHMGIVNEGYSEALRNGALGFGRPVADNLQKVELVQFFHKDCSEIYEPDQNLIQGYNNVTQMCFGNYEKPRGTCEGDSAGPLSRSEGCRFEVIGVTSYGLSCGVKKNAGLYTRVEYYSDWIQSIVWL